jgi:putative ATP-dependent DNA ligase
MDVTIGRTNSHKNFFFKCRSCNFSYDHTLPSFVKTELSKIVGLESHQLERSFQRGNIKFYDSQGVNALQFRKRIHNIESGTMICFGDEVEVIRGFPKIRRTLMLSSTLKDHFTDEVAVEEKMNGYNVRIALVNGRIIAFTRGGYICPYTTRKAPEIMDMTDFFKDHPELVICGEMVGTENPYVTHYYKEIGSLGFRIFDLREKVTNQPMSLHDKREMLEKYGLPPVRLFGIYDVDEAVFEVESIIKNLEQTNREGVVMKDPQMQTPPLKYTSSHAHADELKYAFTYPFDFGRPFFFSRVIREGFQAYELNESGEDLKKRAQRLGEAILYPMLNTIKHVSKEKVAGEDLVIHVDSYEEAAEFVHHLQDLGVVATVHNFEDGKAVIRRIHQSTTDRITNYLRGGLY